MSARKHTDDKAAQLQQSSTSSTTDSLQSSRESDSENDKYLDLMIDVAFKFVFSKKKFMIPLLNAILQRKKDPIADITYLPTEQVAEYEQGKKVVFDLSCKTSDGCIFVIEMQYQYHPYFKERAFYYLVRKIEKELVKGEDEKKPSQLTDEEKKQKNKERYKLSPIYGIYLMGFHLEEGQSRLLRDIILTDRLNKNKQFTDVFRMLFVELPVIKREEDCKSLLEKLTYVIHNLKNLKEMPFAKKNSYFKALDKAARENCMSLKEREAYEYERMNRDIYECQMADRFLAGKAEGEAKGRAESEAKAFKEKMEMAKKLISEEGWSLEKIANLLGLSIPELQIN